MVLVARLVQDQGEVIEAHHLVEPAGQVVEERRHVAVRDDRLRDGQQGPVLVAAGRLPAGVGQPHRWGVVAGTGSAPDGVPRRPVAEPLASGGRSGWLMAGTAGVRLQGAGGTRSARPTRGSVRSRSERERGRRRLG